MRGNSREHHVKRTGSSSFNHYFVNRCLFFHREWAATAFWGLQLRLTPAAFVKATTPPARSIKDNTPSSITPTVRLIQPFMPKASKVLELFYSFSEYYGVVTIPAGARGIRVMELNTSGSYLAVRDTQRRYYLNGHWTVDWPGRHAIAGAIFEYKRPYNRPESLISSGPTNETLVIEVSHYLDQELVRSPHFVLFQHFFLSSLGVVARLEPRCTLGIHLNES